MTPEYSYSFAKDKMGLSTLVSSYKTTNGEELSDVNLWALALGSLTRGVTVRAMTAAYAEGETRMENIAHLRLKECDRIAACKVYQGDKYTDASAYDYYEKSRGHILIHPETGELIGKMLLVLKEQGEDAAFDYVRALLREEKQCPTK